MNVCSYFIVVTCLVERVKERKRKSSGEQQKKVLFVASRKNCLPATLPDEKNFGVLHNGQFLIKISFVPIKDSVPFSC